MWTCIECGYELTWAQYEASPSTSSNDVFCSIECRDRVQCERDDCEVCEFVATPLSPALADLAESIREQWLDEQANIGAELAEHESAG